MALLDTLHRWAGGFLGHGSGADAQPGQCCCADQRANMRCAGKCVVEGVVFHTGSILAGLGRLVRRRIAAWAARTVVLSGAERSAH